MINAQSHGTKNPMSAQLSVVRVEGGVGVASRESNGWSRTPFP
jgi:hypothetical protein